MIKFFRLNVERWIEGNKSIEWQHTYLDLLSVSLLLGMHQSGWHNVTMPFVIWGWWCCWTFYFRVPRGYCVLTRYLFHPVDFSTLNWISPSPCRYLPPDECFTCILNRHGNGLWLFIFLFLMPSIHTSWSETAIICRFFFNVARNTRTGQCLATRFKICTRWTLLRNLIIYLEMNIDLISAWVHKLFLREIRWNK